MSKSFAPLSVISVASWRAAFKFYSFDEVLKSIICVLSSSSITSLDYIALYIIYAILIVIFLIAMTNFNIFTRRPRYLFFYIMSYNLISAVLKVNFE